jgi:hypothetical protein
VSFAVLPEVEAGEMKVEAGDRRINRSTAFPA